MLFCSPERLRHCKKRTAALAAGIFLGIAAPYAAEAFSPLYESDEAELSLEGVLYAGFHRSGPKAYAGPRALKEAPRTFFVWRTPTIVYRRFLTSGQWEASLENLHPLFYRQTAQRRRPFFNLSYRGWPGALTVFWPKNALQQEGGSFDTGALKPEEIFESVEWLKGDPQGSFGQEPWGLRYDSPRLWGFAFRLSYHQPRQKGAPDEQMPFFPPPRGSFPSSHSERGAALDWEGQKGPLAIRAAVGYQSRPRYLANTLGRSLLLSFAPFDDETALVAAISDTSLRRQNDSYRAYGSFATLGIRSSFFKVFLGRGKLPLSFLLGYDNTSRGTIPYRTLQAALCFSEKTDFQITLLQGRRPDSSAGRATAFRIFGAALGLSF